jgi:hypothetical protein
MNYISVNRNHNKRKIEKRVIIDFGLSYIKIGANQTMPFKLIRTPADIFLNDKVLDKNSLNIFQKNCSHFRAKVHDLIQTLLFDHLMENVKDLEIYISINALVPPYFPSTLKDVFELDFKAKHVYLCASQTIPIMTSVGRSGIILDFGLTNISFVVFFKGYVLKKHFHFFSKSGLQMLKVLFNSLYNIRDNKEVLRTLSFNDKMEILQDILTRFVYVPDIHEEREVLNSDTNNSKMRLGKRKYISSTKKDVKLSVTYLDSYLTGNFLFEGSQSIQVQMLKFLQEMPISLSAYLVNNVIITGGLSHIKGN